MARYTRPVDHPAQAPPEPPRPDTPAAPPGRRERKKEQTRLALIDTALDLFARQGFEATPVEQITDVLDLSRRTFSRYFAAKEDVVLAVAADAHADVLRHLRAQPATLRPAEALRATYLAFLDDFRAPGREPDLDRYLRHTAVLSSSPTLAARSTELAHTKEAETVAVLAARLGLDPATDLRPRYIAAAWGAAIRVAVEDLLTRCPVPDLDGWGRAIETAFELYAQKESGSAPAAA